MSIFLALASAATPVAKTEVPTLSRLLSVMQPYLECRSPYDRQMIELETSLRGATYAPRPADRAGKDVVLTEKSLALANSDARDACNYLDLELQIFGMLPKGRGNRAYSARDLIQSAEDMRRIQLTYEEDLFVWQVPRTVLVAPREAMAIHD